MLYSLSMKTLPQPLRIAVQMLFVGVFCPSLPAATLIYYNSATSGNSVTNLGTLGAAGNGTITTAGTGSVTTVATGGPSGAGDAFLNLSSTTLNGGWVTAPANLLPNFRNNNWSVSGFFNRPANTNSSDVILHFGSGDTFGSENELYLYGQSGNNNVRLEHFPGNGLGSLQSSLALNTWHSYAITFTASGLNDGTGTLALYLNGNAVGSSSNFNLSTGGSGDGGVAQTLQIGGIGYASNSGSADRALTGGIDEFAVYDLVLNSTEVAALHNRTITPLDVIPEPSRVLLILVAAMGWLSIRRR
ncbi:LamG domain-containing protein [Phragmitibacter flavus]|uniref:LamG domain-containing protein n=1 Tax=Phragmitibacter flavus TaxID=2576071 RepID=A0A5R8K7B0_9BACT|nr:LamG domain-containing protein [Phragmitibacter flavus]TLD68251.1 LamG domain-containing protein [Phragmitibacter flavus]